VLLGTLTLMLAITALVSVPVTSHAALAPSAMLAASQGPTLLSPASGGAPHQLPENPPVLAWKPVAHARAYVLEVDNDPDFIDAASATIPTTSYVIQNPQLTKTSYWHVRAILGSGEATRWSPTWSYSIAGPHEVSGLSVAPGPNDRVEDVVFDWDPVPGARDYDIRVSTDQNFSASSTVYMQTVKSTRYSPPTTYDNDQYYWQVRARDVFGNVSPWTDYGLIPRRQFQRYWPDRPQLLYPGGLYPGNSTPPVVSDPIFFQWQPIDHASHYEVELSTDPNFSPGRFETCVTRAATFTPRWEVAPGLDVGCRPTPGQTYYWKVRGLDGPFGENAEGGVLGQWSDIHTFTYEPSPINSAATALTPVQGQKVALSGLDLSAHACDNSLDGTHGPEVCTDLKQTPVLSWSPVPGAAYYLLYMFHDRELTNDVYPNLPYIKTFNTVWTPRNLLPDSQAGDAYYWFVRPCKSDGTCAPEPTSASHAFDKRSTPAEPLLTAPTSDATPANELTLTWRDYLATNQANPDATGAQVTVEAQSYRVQISNDPTFATVLDSRVVDQTTYTPYDRTFPEGPLYWRVQAIDGSGNDLVWSDVDGRDPVVLNKNSGTPTLTAPRDLSKTDRTPFLRWAPCDFAVSYDVQIAKNNDRQFSSVNLVVYTNTRQSAYSPAQELPASTNAYVWRVRRLDADGRAGRWSATRSFLVVKTPVNEDTVWPRVRSKSPTRSPASRTANFTVTFSEPVRRVSRTTMRLYEAGRRTQVSARVVGTNRGRTWTLNPARALGRGKRYTLKLGSSITDLAGNRLAATSWSVRTRR